MDHDSRALDDPASELEFLERHLDERVDVWRNVVEADGSPGERIWCHAFQRPRKPKETTSD
jgi:hypothetical protein